jgi:hypothetical protein
VGRDLLRFVHHQLAAGAPSATAEGALYKLDVGSQNRSGTQAKPELPAGTPVTVSTQTDYRYVLPLLRGKIQTNSASPPKTVKAKRRRIRGRRIMWCGRARRRQRC